MYPAFPSCPSCPSFPSTATRNDAPALPVLPVLPVLPEHSDRKRRHDQQSPTKQHGYLSLPHDRGAPSGCTIDPRRGVREPQLEHRSVRKLDISIAYDEGIDSDERV